MSPGQWLKQQIGNSGRQLSLATALGTLAGGALILQAWLLARAIDGALFDQAGISEILPWLLPLLALFFIRALLVWAAEQSAFRAALAVKLRLRSTLLRRIRALGPAWLHGQSTGELASHLADGIEALESYYAHYLPALSIVALVPTAMLVFVLPSDWISGLVMLLTAPLIPVFMILIGDQAERLNQRQWRNLTRMSGHFLDVIQGLTTLKLFNASRREARLIGELSDDYRHSTMSVLRVAFLSSLALEFLASVSIAIVAVLIGFRLLWGELDFATGFFVLLLAPEFYLPLRNLGTHYHARLEAIAAAEPLLAILDTPLPVPGKPVARLRPGASLRVRFEAVHFAYGERPAIQGLDMELRQGETLALVGPSGAGKSTLARLLLGFLQPQRGRILVDSLELAGIDPGDWRERLAWVPQSPRLFHGTVAANIALGANPSADAIRAAARAAHAEAFVDALPEGFGTRIGERGQGLSGGQIQRLALARAFLKDAPIVLLDEPTASLDLESEQLIEDSIRRLADNRTLLIIAHRLASVRNADRVLVMDRGCIVQSGTHALLAGQDGLYRRMVMAYGNAE